MTVSVFLVTDYHMLEISCLREWMTKGLLKHFIKLQLSDVSNIIFKAKVKMSRWLSQKPLTRSNNNKKIAFEGIFQSAVSTTARIVFPCLCEICSTWCNICQIDRKRSKRWEPQEKGREQGVISTGSGKFKPWFSLSPPTPHTHTHMKNDLTSGQVQTIFLCLFISRLWC